MRFENIQQRQVGRFLTRYDVHYRTATGAEKVYEMVSRSANLHTLEQLRDHAPEAVILLLTDASGEHLLLLREFRMAAGRAVFNFPAGLIDAGEDVQQAAQRELREETGLQLLSVTRILPPAYNAVGFSNETNVCLLGTAGGSFAPSSSAEEEIEAGWYSRQQVLDLLQSQPFEARTQIFSLLWAEGRL